MQCATHPTVETHLTCQKCGKAICFRCMVQTPVGYRCPECARVRANPLLVMSGPQTARAVGAALGVAFLGGIGWGVLKGIGIVFGLFSIIAALGIGYAIAEAIKAATNRKPVPSLAYLAAGAAVLSFLIGNVADWVFWGSSIEFNPVTGRFEEVGVSLGEALTHVFDFAARGVVWGVMSMLLSTGMAFYRFR
ncbi:MAG: hypothetical protein IIC80_10265 [Chloroflexi bacterium]|nr:hypothetical protein [Chloroflexota bacterium]